MQWFMLFRLGADRFGLLIEGIENNGEVLSRGDIVPATIPAHNEPDVL